MAVSSYQHMTGRYALVLLRSWPPVQLGIALAMQKWNIEYLEDKMIFDGSFLGRNWKLLRLSMGKSNEQLCTAQLHEHVEQEEDGRRQGRCACDVHAGHPTPAVLASIQSPTWRSLPATPPLLLQLPCSARRC
jgi:hypothetical protein